METQSPIVTSESRCHYDLSTVRRATSGDLPALVAIEQESFIDAWTAETIADSITEPRTIVLVATVDEIVRGYGVAWTLGDEGDIMHLAVAPAWRRHGLGRALLQALLAACVQVGAQRVLLEVRAGNEAAHRLYEQLGFMAVGTRRRYYRDGEDALTMEWEGEAMRN